VKREAPLEHWFAANGWQAFDFQREVWSAYLAGFHAGVEWQWWPGPPDCTGTSAGTGFSFNPGEIIRCDAIAWSLFGLSLAGYNFIFSLVALGAAVAGTMQTLRARR